MSIHVSDNQSLDFIDIDDCKLMTLMYSESRL